MNNGLVIMNRALVRAFCVATAFLTGCQLVSGVDDVEYVGAGGAGGGSATGSTTGMAGNTSTSTDATSTASTGVTNASSTSTGGTLCGNGVCDAGETPCLCPLDNCMDSCEDGCCNVETEIDGCDVSNCSDACLQIDGGSGACGSRSVDCSNCSSCACDAPQVCVPTQDGGHACQDGG